MLLTLARCGTHGIDWFGLLLFALLLIGAATVLSWIVELFWFLFKLVFLPKKKQEPLDVEPKDEE